MTGVNAAPHGSPDDRRVVAAPRDLKLNARWIWPERHQTIPWNCYALFRRAFSLNERPRRPVIARVSADARYALFVNGRWVHFGPARSFHEAYVLDAVDLSPFLQEGPNAVTAVVHQWGVPTFQSVFRDIAGFIFDCRIEEPSGPMLSLGTPDGWLCRLSKAWRRDVARMSIQTGFQEHFDANAEPLDWMSPGYVAKEESGGWHKPVDLGPANVHPWLRLIARPVPLLASEPARFAAVVGVFRGENARGYKVADDVCKLLEGETVKKLDASDAAAAVDQPAGMLRDDDALTTIAPTPDGHFTAVVLELNAYRTGHLVLDLADAAGDEVIDVVYSESLAPKAGWLHFSTGVGGGATCATRYKCRPGAQRWETFNFVGMRNVAVVFRNVERPLKVRHVGVRRVAADVERLGRFECSDETLNRIWLLCRETQEACLLDAFVDCPWREQGMWWGDARVQALVTQHAFGDASILEHGIRLMAQSQAADGSLHAHPPSDIPAHRLPDFMLTWVSTLWDHHWLTGRIDLIQDCLPAVHRVFEFFARHARPDGLIGGFDGWWVFLDWADLHKGDYSAVLNLQYLQAALHAGELCRITGDPRSESRYRALADRLRQAIVDCFWDGKARVFRDGLDATRGVAVDAVSQHANALAILLGLQPEHHSAVARDVLLKPARQKKPSVVTGSPFFYAYVLAAMVKAGLGEDAVGVIGEKWGRWLEQGAVSCWETWEPTSLSKCHAWSASPLYLLMQLVLGVNATEPAFRRLRIQPLPGKLEFARGAVPTPSGTVEVEWERAGDDQLAVRIVLPEGIEAEFVGPTGSRRTLRAGSHQFQA